MLYKTAVKMPRVNVATGLYSHLDSVIKVDDAVLSWIKNSKKERPKGIVLNSIEKVVYALQKNEDDEFFISKEIYEKLSSLFPRREIRTGGNGNNAGRTLFELGIVPLVSYPTRSERLMRASPDFKVAVGSVTKTPIEAVRKDDPDYEHVIFESEKWRSIFSWDLTLSEGIFDEGFLKLAFDPKLTDIAIISYAHLLLPKYKNRTDYVLDFIKSKRPKIHLEFGMGSEESMRYAMERFSENDACDSWGLNEIECKLYLKAGSEGREDLIESALKALKEYNLKRICVHSSKFVFSISTYDVNKEAEALRDACLVAGSKASAVLKTRGKVLKKRLERYNLCLVPTFYNPHPRKLTGLGDAFSAVQAVKILG